MPIVNAYLGPGPPSEGRVGRETSPSPPWISVGAGFILRVRMTRGGSKTNVGFIRTKFMFSQCCLVGFLGRSKEITHLTKYLVTCPVPADQPMAGISVKVTGPARGQWDFRSSKKRRGLFYHWLLKMGPRRLGEREENI